MNYNKDIELREDFTNGYCSSKLMCIWRNGIILFDKVLILLHNVILLDNSIRLNFLSFFLCCVFSFLYSYRFLFSSNKLTAIYTIYTNYIFVNIEHSEFPGGSLRFNVICQYFLRFYSCLCECFFMDDYCRRDL